MVIQKIKSSIPDLITVTSLLCGVTAIFKAIEGEWSIVISCMMASCILDALDGKAARFLKVSSAHGELIDSLVDIACFGIVPVALLFIAFKEGSWALYIYVIVILLRLIRFSEVPKLTRLGSDGTEKNFFMGLASPIAAFYTLVPLILSFILNPNITDYEDLYSVYIVVIAALAYFPIPVYSMKYLPKKFSALLVALFLILCIGVSVIWSPQLFILGTCALYLVSIPVSCIHYFSLKKKPASM